MRSRQLKNREAGQKLQNKRKRHVIKILGLGNQQSNPEFNPIPKILYFFIKVYKNSIIPLLLS